MTKRFVAVFLTMVLWLSTVAAFGITATAATAATITIGTVSGEKGDVVILPVSVSEGSYMVNADMYVLYDSTRLAPVKTYYDDGAHKVSSALFDSNWACFGNEKEIGRYWISFATGETTGLENGGEMFRMAFRILADDVQSMPVTAEVVFANSNDGTGPLDKDGYPSDDDLFCTVVDGGVTIGEKEDIPTDPTRITGDLNFDGSITMQDALLLYRGLALGTLTGEREEVSDYTGDGVVTMVDAFKLYRFVAGLEK